MMTSKTNIGGNECFGTSFYTFRSLV